MLYQRRTSTSLTTCPRPRSKPRANAAKLVAALAYSLLAADPGARLVSLSAGTAANAIPPTGSARFVVPVGNATQAGATLQARWAELQQQYGALETGMALAVDQQPAPEGQAVLAPEGAARLVGLVRALPNGALKWDSTLPGARPPLGQRCVAGVFGALYCRTVAAPRAFTRVAIMNGSRGCPHPPNHALPAGQVETSTSLGILNATAANSSTATFELGLLTRSSFDFSVADWRAIIADIGQHNGAHNSQVCVWW